MGIVEFLTTCLAEDERIARAADPELNNLTGCIEIEYPEIKADEVHALRHSPARVLREIEVDRELLAEYERLLRGHAAHKAEAARMAEVGDDDPTRIAALRREADYLPAMLHVMERWAKQKAGVYADREGYAEVIASAG